MKILERIKQLRCHHDHIEHDLTSVEIHEEERISIKIWCSDCGKAGWIWYEYKETEWK